MSKKHDWDLVVVGAGPMGISTAWNYAKANKNHKILVIDQHGLNNQYGGSSGDERHWRLQYTELEIFKLTAEAHKLWKELEVECDRRLIHKLGSLWFGDTEVHTNEGQISQTMKSMDDMELPYERLSASSIQERYGFTNLDPNHEGFLQPDGGVIDVRCTINALYTLATELGVMFRFGDRISSIEPSEDIVTVFIGDEKITTKKIVLANGAGGKALMEALGVEINLSNYEMTCLTVNRIAESAKPLPFWFIFQRPTDEDTNLFYGFPPNPWSINNCDRLGANFEVDPVLDDRDLTYEGNPRHLERSVEFVKRHMPFLDPGKGVSTSTCVAVLSNDPTRLFYIDTAKGKFAGGENVVVCLGGWTFKFIPLMGRICADLASTGETQRNIAALQFER